MAEQSKNERRDAAREARRVAQEQAAKDAAKARVRSIGITLVSLLVIGALVWLALDNVKGKAVAAAILIDRDARDEVFEAAGCEVLAEDTPNPGENEHVQPASAPAADAMYPFEIRPTVSGPHFIQTLPIVAAGASNQLDERGLTHNMEHGAIIVWYDPAQVDGGAVGTMENLSETLNDSGFASSTAGAGIFVTPYTEPGISSGKAIALRAWGQAVDCDTFSDQVAYHFIRENYGNQAIAPEGNFAPYPIKALAYRDEAAPSTDAPTDTPSDLGTMAPSPTDTSSPSPSDSTSPGPTDTTSPSPTDTPSPG